MKVKALKSFVATIGGKKIRAIEGDELELPKGAEKLLTGLIEPIARGAKKKAKKKAKPAESAAIEPPEKAVEPAASKKKPAAKKKS